MKKRILSILLLCCMVLTLLPTTAFAADESPAVTNVTVTFDSNGGGEVESQTIQQGQQVQRPADPVKEGYTFIGWYDKNDLDNKYYNMPEWNFRYSVTKDMVLVAQWMEPMPISTEPITYLDKDGNQQVCNKYTVLTSNTAGSILDLTDKWYDLPAGWYVVKGNVTFTPRLDTHGAVNLILTDGSHLTTEWGINVKEGDTFTVYAQSTDENTMGRLTACLSEGPLGVEYYVWPSSGLSGIGSGGTRWRKANSGIDESEGTIIINGGYILAKGQDGASAIGGGGGDNVTWSYESDIRQCGSITINGGIVRTEALTREETLGSVGIGSCRFGYGGSVTINGGTVMANASHDAICTGRGGSITINGGDITARGGLAGLGSGNGIGPSRIASADITINGGNIDASTNREGAAIGGVYLTTVKITGGTIKAVGDYATVAIGNKEWEGGSVSITGGKVTAIGKGDADGIGGYAGVSITGGEIDVSVEGSGVAIGGNAGGSINIQGNAIKSISSRSGACIGGSAKNITILDAELPFLGGEGLLIGNEVGDNTGGDLTIRNCRILSTDIAANRGIQVGNNGKIQIENSEIVLTGIKGIRTGDSGSITIRDSQLVTNGIYMGEEGMTQRKLKRLEITNSTVVTNDVLGSTGKFTSVGEIVIHGSSIRQSSEDRGNGFGIGCGEYGTFDRIDIQDSQIDIPGFKGGVAIGGGKYTTDPGNSVIRIANSRVFARTRDRWSTAIGRDIGSSGDGALRIFIENSTVTAKGGWLFGDGTEYVPGIGISYKSSLNAYIQVMDSTVESFRHTKSRNMDDSDYVYDDLHTKKLPGNPAENISICGSTVNGTRIDHSLDAYGKCTLCGKYDIGYCYEKGLLTMEGLTDCAYDGSEKKLTGLSHKTGENETKQLTENTDYTASYSNHVYPYTLNPSDAGFDPEKAPKVTLYGTGDYCGKAEHYFTISGDAQPSYTVKFDTAGGTSISNKTGVRWEQRVLDGVEPPTRTDYEFRGWSCSGKPVFPGTTYADLAGDKNVQSITLTAQWAAAWYPEGEIKIEGEDTVWNGFESDYSARFYNTEQTVTISAPKSGGKPVEIGYLITDEDLTKGKCTKRSFTPYTGPLKLNTDGQHIVYAKLTNAEGNVTYLRTTGRIVIDTTPPAINGVEDGEVYYTTKNVQITDDNLASVTVNGSPKTVGGYNTIWIALFSDANRTYKIVVTDKAGNRTEKTITVYDGTYVISVTGVSLDESSITLDVGGNQTLTATVTPEDATNKKVCWSSDNEAVATVSEDGVVTAVAGGTAVITATTHDGLFTASCTVTVNAPDAAPTITTDTLPDGKVGEAYSQTLIATGTTPITWSIIGALPDGLSLNKDTGKISGTPTAAGSSTFTVKATNSAGSDTKELSITITKDAPPAHEHSYGDWRKDGTSHWHECTDDDCPNREESINDKAAHVYDDDADTTCDVCGYERTVTPPSHEHSYGDWSRDGTNHWHECTDDDCPNREESINDKAAHVYTDDADMTCDVCGYERTVTPPSHEHSYGDWRKDGTSHWHECTDDDCPDREESIKDKAAHVYTDDADTTCDTCGYERTITPPAHEHRYGDWRKDGTNHWHECTDADCPNREESIKDKAAHVYTDDADTTCDTCGYERTITPPAHKHRYGDWRKDGTNHWHECTDADCPNREESIKDKTAHVYDNDADTTCNTCGYERTVTPPAHEHIVTFDGNGGTSSVGSMTTTNQKLTSLPSASRSGSYSFDGWYTKKNGGTEITTDTEFPADTTVYAHWTYTGGGGSSGYSYYTIKATAGTGGSISPSGNVSVREGRDQTFTITPDKGYAVANVKIDGKSIGAAKSYTFENVSRTHTIEVIFMKANGNPQTGVFVDVATGSYYEDAVDWAVENGITQGTDDTHFSPDGICTRAQAVTFLWRAAGSPEPETRAMPFTDVPVGSYYYDAVLWAVENGITKGTSDTTFSPNMTCTRAQIVAFLWRSEKSPAAGTANPFADVKSTAYYAGAVLWAVKENITKGTTSTTFSPNADCTRAQIVTFLWRCKK